MAQGNFIQVTPFMYVDDVEEAVRFFTDLLDFEAPPEHRHGRDYAYVHRETVGVRIMRNHGSDGAPPGNRRFAYYIDVRDVDGLHAELKPRLDALPQGHVHGPVNQSYGQREFMIVAPDGNLLVFGQSIAT